MLALSYSGHASANGNQRQIENICAYVRDTIGVSTPGESRTPRATCEAIYVQADRPAALDRVAAEEVFALGDALTVSADQQIGNIQSRINRVRTGHRKGLDISSHGLQLGYQPMAKTLHTSNNTVTQITDGSSSVDVIKDSALALFASGAASIGEIDGQAIQRDADISANSLTLGADYRLNQQSVIGAAVGIVNDKAEFTGDNGRMDMQGFSVSAFGTWYEQDKGYTDIIAQFGQNDFDLKRRINLTDQPSEFAYSSTDATRISVSINVGRTFQRGATEFGPLGRIAITRASIDGFEETGSRGYEGANTAQNVESHSRASTRISIGGEIKHIISTARAVLVPTLRVELENETETDKGEIITRFAGGSIPNTMTLTGTRPSSNALLISVGSTAVLKNGQSAFASLETRALDDHLSQYRLRLGYRMHF